MKKKTSCRLMAVLLAAVLLTGCGSEKSESGASDAQQPAGSSLTEQAARPVVFTDALGYEVEIDSWDRVVSLYGSFAEAWTLAGGSLVGATSDAVEERGLALGEQVAIVGSVKNPGFEEILAAEPDFVMLSADIAAQAQLHDALAAAGVPHAYCRVDTFEDYRAMMEQFCGMTGREDLYEQNAASVARRIEEVRAAAEGQPQPTVLLLRAFSTGVKAKGADQLAGAILADLGAENLVEQHESLLEELSMEEIVAADPDVILVVTMGSDEQEALSYLEEHFESNPAWAGLSAVKNGRYELLPKELFHYKPNARWGESYAYLAKILYPDLAGEDL